MGTRSPQARFAIRKQRIRTKIANTTDRNRLSIFKSNRHISAQLISPTGNVLVAASTLEKSIYQKKKSMCNKEYAAQIGSMVAERILSYALSLETTSTGSDVPNVQIVFDRGGIAYHGVIKALADAARLVTKSGARLIF